MSSIPSVSLPLRSAPSIGLSDGACSTPKPMPRFHQFLVVVNIPLQFDRRETLEMRCKKLDDCCATLRQAASIDLQFHIVVGLNCMRGSSLERSLLSREAFALEARMKGIENEYFRIQVTDFTWRPAGISENSIDYVGIRNRLFGSSFTQNAIKNSIAIAKDARIHSVAVKALFIDPDTIISRTNLDQLLVCWQSPDAALINAGFYHFPRPDRVAMCEPSGRMRYIANQFDVMAKREFSKSSIIINIEYRSLSKEANFTGAFDYNRFRRCISRNIFVLKQLVSRSTSPSEGRFLETLLATYEDLKSIIQDVIRGDKNGVFYLLDFLSDCDAQRCLKLIEEQESRGLTLSVDYTLFGRDILYVPEPALALSLYEKIGREEFCFFDKYHRVNNRKRRSDDLWGDFSGGGEGQNLRIKVSRVSETDRLLYKRRKVDYDWEYTTVMPSRMCKEVKITGEPWLETQYKKYMKMPQSFLCDYFLLHRQRFVSGIRALKSSSDDYDWLNIGSYSPYPRGIVEDVLEVLPRWIGAVQACYAHKAKEWIRSDMTLRIVFSTLKKAWTGHTRTDHSSAIDHTSSQVAKIVTQYVG